MFLSAMRVLNKSVGIHVTNYLYSISDNFFPGNTLNSLPYFWARSFPSLLSTNFVVI